MKRFIIKLLLIISFIIVLAMLSSCIPPYWDITHSWFPSGIPIIGFPIGIIGLGIYFLPTIIAAARRNKSVLAIVLINVFAGWTFIGWIIALVWSLIGETLKR